MINRRRLPSSPELNRDFDLADVLARSLAFVSGHILADGVSDVLERLLFSIPLGPATRQPGTETLMFSSVWCSRTLYRMGASPPMIAGPVASGHTFG
jgi:hypothetical protein